MEELVNVVHEAFSDTTHEQIENSCLSLMKHMEATIAASWNNDYKTQILNKVKRRRAGEDVSKVFCDPAVLSQAWQTYVDHTQ